MNIQHQENEGRGTFFIKEDGELVAEIVYSWSAPHEMTIHHTNVDEELEGQGIGKQLVQKAVALAREKNSKIIPLCSFANAVLTHEKTYQDVLKTE